MLNTARQRCIIVVLSTLLAILLALQLFGNREPTHQGKSVKQWCKVLWAGSPADQTNAVEAIHRMGTNMIPVLEEMVRSRDTKLRSAFLELCSKQSMVNYPYLDQDVDYQRIAMKAIDALGEEAEPMEPFLQEVIRSWTNYSLDVVYAASRIASKFEPETTPILEFKDGTMHLVFPTNTYSSNE